MLELTPSGMYGKPKTTLASPRSGRKRKKKGGKDFCSRWGDRGKSAAALYPSVLLIFSMLLPPFNYYTDFAIIGVGFSLGIHAIIFFATLFNISYCLKALAKKNKHNSPSAKSILNITEIKKWLPYLQSITSTLKHMQVSWLPTHTVTSNGTVTQRYLLYHFLACLCRDILSAPIYFTTKEAF